MALVVAGASVARATVMWDLGIDAGFQGFAKPEITLTNTSDAGEFITRMEFSVGDLAFIFDRVMNGPGANIATELTTGATLTAGDRDKDGIGVAILVWTFSDFAPGESLVFRVEFDPPSNQNDARTIFFNNGSSTNSGLVVEFDASGQVVTDQFVLPDGDPNDPGFLFSSPGPTPPIPEPGTGNLVGFGLIALSVLRRVATPEHSATRR